MRVGDIIENPFTTAGKNPLHHSMYLRTSGKYFKALYFDRGEIREANFFRSDKEIFKVVGHLEEYDQFKNALAKMVRDSAEKGGAE